jgi:aminoglycoside phosphotransferase (APT) family kinase protein
LAFDARALLQIIVKSVNRQIDCVSTFSKIAEGGAYRVFEAAFEDKTAVIARLPYPCTLPPSFGIASEVATMQFLRLHGVPVPQLYAWASSAENALGSAYTIMVKVEGKELEHTWYEMSVSEEMSMIEKVVQIEQRLFQI